jgi:ribosome recycling factor
MNEASIRTQMQKVLDLCVSDVAGIRSGRATSSLVENIVVPAYGGQQRLKIQELATISLSDPQTIVIDPWDKSIIGDIKKGILEANIGLSPALDGEVIRLSVPPLTTEDKQSFIKLLNQKLESGKVMIRQVRGEAIKEVQKAFTDKEFGEDEKFDQEKKVQEITDEFVGKIEGLGEKKKQDLLQI